MTLLNRYFFSILMSSILTVLFVILGIDFLASVISEFSDLVERYDIKEALLYSLLRIPRGISEYAGYSALIGAMIGLGALSKTGELSVIRSSGVSSFRIGWMCMRPALVLILTSSLLAEFVAPVFDQRAESRKTILRGESAAQKDKSGIWVFDQDTYVRIDAVHPSGQLTGVRRYLIDAEEGMLDVFVSESGSHQSITNEWVLTPGLRSVVKNDLVSVKTDDTIKWDTGLNPRLLDVSALKLGQLSVRDLSEFSDYLGDEAAQSRKFRVEFWRKLMSPIAILALVFIGISFVFGSNRSVSAGERIFIGVAVATAFKLAQEIFGPASVVWGISAFVAVLVPILIVAIVGVFLLRRAN